MLRRSKVLRIMAQVAQSGIVVLLVASLLTVAGAGCMETTTPPGEPARGGYIPTQYTTNIVNGIVTVDGGEYQYHRITVQPGWSNVLLSGSFRASGGSGNDVIVFVTDEMNFINWQNGHAANANYNSGQVTVGTISAPIHAAGTYFLVYDNTFSVFSQKNVQTVANLEYVA